MIMRNFNGGVRGKKGRLYTPTHNLPNIDVWLVGTLILVHGARGLVPHLADSTQIINGKATNDSDTDELELLPPINLQTPLSFEGLLSLLLELGQVRAWRGRWGCIVSITFALSRPRF
jgi:hypothetical protein